MQKFWGILISEWNKKQLPRIFKFEDKILAVITLGAMLVKGAEYSVNRNDRHKAKTFIANVSEQKKSSDPVVAREDNIRYIKECRSSETLFLVRQYNDNFRSLETVAYAKIEANYNNLKPWEESLEIERKLKDDLAKLARQHKRKMAALTEKYKLILEYAEKKVQPKLKTKGN